MNNAEKLIELESLQYAKAHKNLATFTKSAWKVLEPNTKLMWNWHHSYICEYLTACKLGQIRRLIINVAPRTTKSILSSVCFPDWVWTDTPHSRFLFGSYASDLAIKHSVLRRNLIESDWYQSGYKDVYSLSSDVNTKSEFTNNKTGKMRAAGILGSITGDGGDYIIIDDPHNPKGSESEKERPRTLENFDLAWSNRLNDKKTGCIIIIMQRLHEQDLTGHLIAKELGYEHVKIPTIAEENQTLIFPLSNKSLIREPGDLLHPSRDGEIEIDREKKSLGSYGFAGQHQQRPSPKGGGIVKRDWWKFYKQLPSDIDFMCMSCDLTFKDGEKNDFCVFQIWGRKGPDKYFIDQIRSRMGFNEQIVAFTNLMGKHKLNVEWVEDAANGAALVDALKRKFPSIIPVRAVGSKVARAESVSPQIEAGNVFIPDPSIAPWINDYIEEWAAFPNGKHDDQVDATSQALKQLTESLSFNWSPVSLTGQSKWLGR